MKPYQFYSVRHFPELALGHPARTQYQMTFSGEGEEVVTELTLENQNFEGSLSRLRVKSEVKHETFGFIRKVIGEKRQRLEFNEYLQPVDFAAYHDIPRNIVIFQAPKKVCRGVLLNLRAGACGVELVEMVVDFSKVIDKCSEYLAAWFRGVSSRVRAAGISGDQIQHDALFKKLLRDGQLSNVTIPWIFDDVEHRIMLTSGGAIVLIQDYKANQGFELNLATDVFDKLLSQVWEEKKARRSSDDCPGEP